jgi:hypothetical protein
MSVKRKAVEEKLDARTQEWNIQIVLLKANAEKANTGAGEGEVKTALHDAAERFKWPIPDASGNADGKRLHT